MRASEILHVDVSRTQVSSAVGRHYCIEELCRSSSRSFAYFENVSMAVVTR